MDQADGRTCETCVYVCRAEHGHQEVLLVKRPGGPNAGKWVPLGRPFDRDISPYDQATIDLGEIGLVETPRFRGIVTETCGDGGWQCILFLFAARAPVSWEPPESPLYVMEWYPVGDVEKLNTPQADRHFDLTSITNPLEPAFHASISFSGDGTLAEVRKH